MKQNRPFNALDDIAREYIPDHADVVPRLASRVKERPAWRQRRMRPLVGFLIAVLILLALSGAAYALGRALGYIPGVGVVNRYAAIRVLDAPVTVTRDGITARVASATLSSDKTVIRFTLEGVQVAKVSQDIGKCDPQWGGLQLPDGSFRRSYSGYGLANPVLGDSGFEARYIFEPVPDTVNEASFVPPCLQHYLPGAVAEDWALHLHFIPAPPDLTVIPVTEIRPEQQAADGNPMRLEKTIETDGGYIVVGTFGSSSLPQGARAVQFSKYPRISDASGQDVPFTLANYQLDLPAAPVEEGIFSWAFEITGKQFRWPLTINVDSVAAEYPAAQGSFAFDTGPAPREGQEWNLDFGLDLAGFPVKVVRAIRTSDGYSFHFESTTMFHSVDAAIGASTHGTTGMDDPSHFSSSIKFIGDVPSGILRVTLTRPVIALPGNWQRQWQPEQGTSMTLPAPTQAEQACLTLESWEQALSNASPIPAELNGKVLVSGRLLEDGHPLSEQNTGIYISRLDGSDKQEILQGHNWASPSFSPDGLRVVYDGTGYAGADGLNILELASGDTRIIPNTTADDMAPLWSLDGSRIAFVRYSEQDLYVIHPDGSGLQKITTGSEYEQPVGWWPDDSAFIYSTLGQDGALLSKFDMSSATASGLFVAATELGVAVSPGGTQIAFEVREPPAAVRLYISRPDGSERNVIGFMNDYLGISNPHWSPDGKWLLVNMLDAPNMDNADAAAALVNVQTCQIVPAGTVGVIRAWIP